MDKNNEELKVVPLDEKLFGEMGVLCGGFTIKSLREIVEQSNSEEVCLDDMFMDGSVAPKIISDLMDELETQHQQAGIAINHQSAIINSVSIAHCAMANILQIKKLWNCETGHEDDLVVKLDSYNRGIISDCMIKLVQLGLTHEEANERIIRGY